MKRFAVLFLAALLLGQASGPAALAGKTRKPAPSAPSSPRSREAVARVTPGLKTALAEKGLAFGAPVFIRIFKEEKLLELWLKGPGKKYVLFKTYPVCTYSGGLGPKLKAGDRQAPEGFYEVPPGALNPSSDFHLSFNIGYPNAYDRAHGRTGGAIMVHGSCVSIGCYAMGNEGIEEIFALADAAFKHGQRAFSVHIFPFRMSRENLESHKGPYRIGGISKNKVDGLDRQESPEDVKEVSWADFWRNLAEGYDLFERDRLPPNVSVRGGRYVFGGK